jgi:peroxiredoxin
MFIFYTAWFSRLAPYELSLKVGDPFPEFELQTSTGEWFSPASIQGKKAALYIFYRGDW